MHVTPNEFAVFLIACLFIAPAGLAAIRQHKRLTAILLLCFLVFVTPPIIATATWTVALCWAYFGAQTPARSKAKGSSALI
ncbi:hypothetical protein J2W53_005110 [Pseudomonas frederiksbergensis]|nr:hypothetical protein [Pseudomonas frederiksbergensis]